MCPINMVHEKTPESFKKSEGRLKLYRGSASWIVDGEKVSSCWIYSEGSVAYISDLSTEEGYRRKGYASSMLYEICKKYEKRGIYVTLEVFEGNKIAKNCYKKMGFRPFDSFICRSTKAIVEYPEKKTLIEIRGKKNKQKAIYLFKEEAVKKLMDMKMFAIKEYQEGKTHNLKGYCYVKKEEGQTYIAGLYGGSYKEQYDLLAIMTKKLQDRGLEARIKCEEPLYALKNIIYKLGYIPY